MSTTDSMRISNLDLHHDASCGIRSVTVLDRRQSQKQLLTCMYAREVPNDNPCGTLVTSQAAPDGVPPIRRKSVWHRKRRSRLQPAPAACSG